MVKKISEKDFKEATAKGVSVVDFSANWCGPCQMLAPVLEEISEELSGSVNCFNVDVDDNPELARAFRVMSIPAVVVLRDGVAVATSVGFKGKEEMMEFIKENM